MTSYTSQPQYTSRYQMSTEIKKEIQLEITHVLFMDIVGYSKMLINEQRALRDIIPSGWYNFLVPFSVHADQFFYFGVRLPYAKFPRHPGL